MAKAKQQNLKIQKIQKGLSKQHRQDGTGVCTNKPQIGKYNYQLC